MGELAAGEIIGAHAAFVVGRVVRDADHGGPTRAQLLDARRAG
jgi:hypothetical protein